MDSEANAGTAEKRVTGLETASNLEKGEKVKRDQLTKPVPLQHSITKEKAREAERRVTEDTAQCAAKEKEKGFKESAGCVTRWDTQQQSAGEKVKAKVESRKRDTQPGR